MKNRNNPACNAVALRTGTFTTLLLALSFLALSPIAQAVVPSPDGGYPNFTTAEGTKALFGLTTGTANTAVGWFSLFSDAAGSFNTATGAGSLLFNTADANTAFGAAALLFNTTGSDNTATGASALLSNTEGSNITAIGSHALLSNTADENTAVGSGALAANTTGTQNTAFGTYALTSNTTAGANGSGANTALGAFALSDNTTGGANTAIGYGALATGNGGANTAIGDLAGFNITGNGNIDIGFHEAGVAGENNTTRIADNVPATQGDSACYIGGIAGQPVPTATAAFVFIDTSTGKLGTVIVNANGEPMAVPTLQGAQPQAMLNEILKEHRRVQEQGATIADLKKEIAGLTATVKEQAAQIQKVGAQVEESRPVTKVVLSSQ
jgi:hypothetical protein